MQKAARNFHACAVAALVVFSTTTPVARAADAVETCRVVTYYAGADMKAKVGTVSTCRGTERKSGRKTRHARTEVVEYADRTEDPTVHPGSLPCEYPTECANEQPTPVPSKSHLIARR
jgi:hypothetical protein